MGEAQPVNPRRSPSAGAVYVLIGLILAGGLLYGSTLLSERLLAPAWLEPITHSVYRISYFLRLPTMVIFSSRIPMEGHHTVQFAWSEILTSFAAPFFWCAVAAPIVLLRLRARRRSKSRETSGIEIPRRAFLIGAVGVIGSSSLVGGYAVLVEPQRVRVQRYRMAIRNLPDALDGFRIVHVSDTHYGPFVSLRYLNAVIDQANALEGDLVLMTGDYVHRTPLSIGPGVDVLKRLHARLGVFATLGNHDHWEGAKEVRAAFDEIKFPLLDNARVFLMAKEIMREPVEEAICIGGIGDLWEDKMDFNRALEDAPEEMPRLVLSHNPDAAEQLSPALRVDLMLSGHTHGGQVWVPGLGTPIVPSGYGQKYAGGLCQGPHCPVVVSRGIGMAILPVRFGVPPEIGEITLVRSER